ncbi:hypothetical protein T4B_12105 [Trichinella pseudospiralis]|uniref:Uncharacterized protein n=1 Tax=Trichinella pseudospiralis TaxID=6337 RepID=A0A0V1GG90_TRIPS|nr:hypothetical protein T4B_12105 [Trichinella pseudospiralis]KRY99479.1 hypothetical protein T4C_7827 [Trichinella pseudospiralis]KRZ01131.1 hypothetical protein T4C_11113 [Trichinella pseudospiralis]
MEYIPGNTFSTSYAKRDFVIAKPFIPQLLGSLR